MKIDNYEALLVLADDPTWGGNYSRERLSIKYVIFVLSIVDKYMQEASERNESLTAAFVDTLGEIIFILTEVEGDLCESDDG